MLAVVHAREPAPKLYVIVFGALEGCERAREMFLAGQVEAPAHACDQAVPLDQI